MDDKQKSRKYFDSHSSTFLNRNGYWNYDYRLTSRILKKRNVKKLVETRMRKAKRKFLRIEMLVVRNEYQGQGFMRKMMEFTYHLADKKHVPVILDTDDKDKAARYEHLGMKLDRVRSCGERFHMYDLIRE